MYRKLSTMITLATNAHAGQFDKQGMPYILHPLKVMHYLKSVDEELMCIAVGHDLLEDTDIEMDSIGERFGHRICDGIVALTKYDWMSQSDYEDRVCENKDAMLVKLADLRHNTDIRRLKGVGPKDMERMDKYCKFSEKIRSKLQ